jgi:hypothetical protein
MGANIVERGHVKPGLGLRRILLLAVLLPIVVYFVDQWAIPAVALGQTTAVLPYALLVGQVGQAGRAQIYPAGVPPGYSFWPGPLGQTETPRLGSESSGKAFAIQDPANNSRTPPWGLTWHAQRRRPSALNPL